MERSIGELDTMGPGETPRQELEQGARLGRYIIIRLLGRGGMGQVYLARHEMQRTLHALKLLPAEAAARKGFVERFQTELRTMARLQHPNIVHVQYSDEEHGRYYLVMDFIAADDTEEPYDLEEALAEHGRMEAATARRLALQICEGLAFAHREQVVHRDLKPANILLTSRNLDQAEARVGDFGLARVLGEEQVRTMVARSMQLSMSIGNLDTFVEKRRVERSSTGAVLGTYGYMSPEQEEGRPADGRSDIYALGVLLYRMITGQRLRGRAKAASTLVKGLDPAWDSLIDKCLEPDPGDRWQSMEELKAALEGIEGQRRGGSGATGRGKPVRALAVLVLLAALGVGAWWLVGGRRDTQEGRTEVSVVEPVAEPVTEDNQERDPRPVIGPGHGPGGSGVVDVGPVPGGQEAAVGGAQARLVVRPAGAQVTIHNEERTVGMGTTGEDGEWSLVLLPGKYDLIAQKDGYELLTLAFEMGDEPIDREWSLTPLRGMVNVTTVPGSAVKVRRAGTEQEVELGVADGEGKLVHDRLVEGDYDLVVEHPDYHAHTERIEVRKDRAVAVAAILAGRPGSIFIAASPQAEVWVDGEHVGMTGALIEGLEPGERRMEVRRSGYRTERFTQVVTPNSEASRKVLGDLTRESGSIRVDAQAPGYATEHLTGAAKRVRVGTGAWKDIQELPWQEDGLPCEEHEVRLEVTGYRVTPEARRVEVTDGETVTARFELQPLPANLTVRSSVPSAAVYDAKGTRLGVVGTALAVPSLIAQQLIVRAERHQERSLEFRAGALLPGGAYSQEVTLVESFGTIRVEVQAPGYAAEHLTEAAKRVRVGTGAWKDIQELPWQEDGLAREEHEVRLEVTGYRVTPEARRVEVTDGETVTARFELQPLPANLTVRSSVPSAAVYDAKGTRLGVVGTALAVPSLIAQQLIVRAERHQERQFQIRAGVLLPGGTYRQEVTLVEIRDPTVGNILGMEFVEVKAGNFEMGTPSGGDNDERPVRTVRITRDFWMGKYEVTNSEYQQLTGSNPSFSKGDNLPVGRVSWDDAVRFCEYLTRREREAGRLPSGYVYRLPTEAEWEYAARGGHRARTTTYSGSNNIDAVAWHRGNSGWKAQPVGAKAANELGLHDMSGNVWEWVHDWYQDSYSSLSTVDPSGPRAGTSRVYRGGSYSNSATFCRVARRAYFTPSGADSILGFRVVLGPSL